MNLASHTNEYRVDSVQGRRLCLTLMGAVLAMILITPLLTAFLGISERKAGISVLRFSFLGIVAFGWNRNGPGLVAEAGLACQSHPLAIWARGFIMGSIPLALFVVVLTVSGERVFDGIRDSGKFWWAVTKYLPLALVIGFLEDMLFFGFLVTLFGQRLAASVLIYAVTHFLAPSKQFDWQFDDWLVGIESLVAMGESLARAVHRPVELIGLILVGATLALLRRQTGNIWLSMGVHGGWYYVRTISRKLGEDVQGSREWLFGTDRFYDGVLGWIAITSTALIFWVTWNRAKMPTKSPRESQEE